MDQTETEEENFKRSASGKKEISGRDLVTGLPKTVEISDHEIREALSLQQIF